MLSSMLECPDGPAAGLTLALPLPASGSSDVSASSLLLSQEAGRRSGCKSNLFAGPASPGIVPGRNHGEASSLPVLPVPDHRGPGGSSRSSSRGTSRSTLSSSPGAGLRHFPVHHEGTVYYPSTGKPIAGQAGLPHSLLPCRRCRMRRQKGWGWLGQCGLVAGLRCAERQGWAVECTYSHFCLLIFFPDKIRRGKGGGGGAGGLNGGGPGSGQRPP